MVEQALVVTMVAALLSAIGFLYDQLRRLTAMERDCHSRLRAMESELRTQRHTVAASQAENKRMLDAILASVDSLKKGAS